MLREYQIKTFKRTLLLPVEVEFSAWVLGGNQDELGTVVIDKVVGLKALPLSKEALNEEISLEDYKFYWNLIDEIEGEG